MLTGLDQFLKRIEPEIESIRGNERDTASFMKMMRLFNEVTAQQQVVTIYIIYWFEIYGALRDEDMHRIKVVTTWRDIRQIFPVKFLLSLLIGNCGEINISQYQKL